MPSLKDLSETVLAAENIVHLPTVLCIVGVAAWLHRRLSKQTTLQTRWAALASAHGATIDPGAIPHALHAAGREALVVQLGLLALAHLVMVHNIALLLDGVWLGAIARDTVTELRFRATHGALVTVRRLDDPGELPLLLTSLAATGVDCLPRTAAHRGLVAFFGPHLPIDLLAPASALPLTPVPFDTDTTCTGHPFGEGCLDGHAHPHAD